MTSRSIIPSHLAGSQAAASGAPRFRSSANAWSSPPDGVGERRAQAGNRGAHASAASGAAPVLIDGHAIDERFYGASDAPAPLSAYFAQHIAQEVLPEGLYLDPHPAGIAAYRDVLTLVAAQGPSAAGLDLQA